MMDRNHYRAGRDDYCERWLYTEEEAAHYNKYGVGRPFRESPRDPDQAHIDALYYTRVKLKCMFGVNDPEQYSDELILLAWKDFEYSQHYDRVASFILIREVLSNAGHVTCTIQEISNAMNSDVTVYRDPNAVALNLLRQNVPTEVGEEAHNTPPTKRLKLWSTDATNSDEHSFTSHVVDETAAGESPIPESIHGRCNVFDENHERREAAAEIDKYIVHRPPSNEDAEEGEDQEQQLEEDHADNANIGDDDDWLTTSSVDDDDLSTTVVVNEKEAKEARDSYDKAMKRLSAIPGNRFHDATSAPASNNEEIRPTLPVATLPEDSKTKGHDKASENDSLSDTDNGRSVYEEQSKKKKTTSSSSRPKKVLYKGPNKCGACIHGLGGLMASNAAKAKSSDTTSAEDYDLFDNCTFKTSSRAFVPWSLVEGLKGEENKMKLKQFIFKHGGSIIHHSIDGSSEHEALAAIVYHAAMNGDIQALSSKSRSVNDPKTDRSGWSLFGCPKMIVSEWPDGYSPISSARGEDVVNRLKRAVAANCEAVGAFPEKCQLFGHNWKKGVRSTNVGGKGAKGGLLMGSHPDQNKANDPLFYTARNCIATITPFNIDFILFFVCLTDRGTQSKHKIGVITLTLPENVSYYLPHRLSGRAALAQSERNGKQGLLVAEHCVYLNEADMQSPRSVLIEDLVFPTEELHNRFLQGVDPNDEYQLPSTFNNIASLFNELSATDPSLQQYFNEGRSLFQNVSNTIKSLLPFANQFNLQCSGSTCSNTASALDLREDEEEHGGRSGEDLLLQIQSIYKKRDLLAGGRLLCLGCTSDIPDGQVLRNLCLRCLMRPTLSRMKYCKICGDYRCIGYLVDGTKVYECEPGGVKLDEENIAPGKAAVCAACKSARGRVFGKVRDTSGDDEKVEIMRAIHELNDETWQKKKEIKKYLELYGGKYRVSWNMARHPEDGYGPLKGKTKNETQTKYENFRRSKDGIDIKSLEQFNDYIAKGGKIGQANKGRSGRKKVKTS